MWALTNIASGTSAQTQATGCSLVSKLTYLLAGPSVICMKCAEQEDREQSKWLPRAGGEGSRTFWVWDWGSRNVVKLDCGDDYTTLYKLRTLNCTLKQINYISVMLLKV